MNWRHLNDRDYLPLPDELSLPSNHTLYLTPPSFNSWLLVCMFVIAAEVVLSPRLGNQLGGTPVLVRGLCLEPTDFIQCIFDGRVLLGDYFDPNTAICPTPIMFTTGEVDVSIRRFRQRSRIVLESSFTTGMYSASHQKSIFSV